MMPVLSQLGEEQKSSRRVTDSRRLITHNTQYFETCDAQLIVVLGLIILISPQMGAAVVARYGNRYAVRYAR